MLPSKFHLACSLAGLSAVLEAVKAIYNAIQTAIEFMPRILAILIRVFEGELTQIVRAGLEREELGVDATSPLEILDPEAAPGPVTVQAGGIRLRVSLSTVKSDFYGSCNALAQTRVSHARRIVYAGAERM